MFKWFGRATIAFAAAEGEAGVTETTGFCCMRETALGINNEDKVGVLGTIDSLFEGATSISSSTRTDFFLRS